MKNVLKRLIELINLFKDDSKISTNKIKDSIPDYRDLNEQAFRRAFERDKSLLRSFGYLIEYSNDKWSHDESGYTMGGAFVFNNIKTREDVDVNSFVNTYLLLKNFISLQGNNDQKTEIISKITKALNEKRRLGFEYLSKYRKVKPQGLRIFNGSWYLGAIDSNKFKTFKLDYIENLKLGNKANLFATEYKNMNFSWEELDDSISIEINIPDNLYRVNKNVFSHKLSESKKTDLKSIKTNDWYGLFKFLLLCDGSYRIKKINNAHLLKDLLDV